MGKPEVPSWKAVIGLKTPKLLVQHTEVAMMVYQQLLHILNAIMSSVLRILQECLEVCELIFLSSFSHPPRCKQHPEWFEVEW